jgi:hypothetical protein
MTNGNTVTLDLAASRTFSKIVMNSGGSTSDYARGYRTCIPDPPPWARRTVRPRAHGPPPVVRTAVDG